MSDDIISLSDRIKELSYSTGTGDFSLDGAVAGFSSFGDVYQNNDALFYAITDGSSYEIGSGQYIVIGGNDYLRRYPFRSTNGNGLVDFPNGAKEIYVTYPGNYAVFTASGLSNFQRPQSSGIAFWRSQNILDYDNNLVWDYTNNKLGINSTNPVSALHIGGTVEESILTVSGIVLGTSGVWFSGTPYYTGGVQLEPFLRSELDETTGTAYIFELSGIVDQRLLFKKQIAGTVLAGPSTGCETPPCNPDYPSFRGLTANDIPPLDYVSADGPCDEGEIPFCNGAGQLTYDDNFVWDKVNNRLGVNTSSPGYTLDVAGHGKIAGDLDVGDTIFFSDNSTISGAYIAGSGLSLHNGRTFNVGNLFQLTDTADNTGWIHQADLLSIKGVDGIFTEYRLFDQTLFISGDRNYYKWIIGDQNYITDSIGPTDLVLFSGIDGINTQYDNINQNLIISALELSGNLNINIVEVSGWNKQYTDITSGNLYAQLVAVSGWNKLYTDITSGNLHNEIVEVSGWNKQYTDITSGNLYNQIVNVSGWAKSYIDITSGNLHNEIVEVSGWNKQYTDITSGNLYTQLIEVSGWNKQYTDITSGNLHSEIVEVSGWNKQYTDITSGNLYNYIYSVSGWNKQYTDVTSGNLHNEIVEVSGYFENKLYSVGSGLTVVNKTIHTAGTGNFSQIVFGPSSGNISLGVSAGYGQLSNYNIYAGYQAGYQNSSVQLNNHTNIMLGYQAGFRSWDNEENVYIGRYAGWTASGNRNIYLGRQAGVGNKGHYNIEIIADNTPSINSTYDEKINIGNIIKGDLSTKKLSIGGTLNPQSTLDVCPSNATNKGIIVQAYSLQSANLQEWRNEYNTPTWVNNSGVITASSGIIYTSVIPESTTNTLYNKNNDLYWQNCKIITECNTNSIFAMGSGLTLVGNELNTAGSGNFKTIVFGPPHGNISLGYKARQTSSSTDSRIISIGYWDTEQSDIYSSGTINIGYQAGNNKIASSIKSIHLGNEAGASSSGEYSINIGDQAGSSSRQHWSVSIGPASALGAISNRGVNIGTTAGNGSSGELINIGWSAGYYGSGYYAINHGINSGRNSYLYRSINLGYHAGYYSESNNAVNLGAYAGQYSVSSTGTINIGNLAGQHSSKTQHCIHIGDQAGQYIDSTPVIGVTDGTSWNNIYIGKMAGNLGTSNRSNSIEIINNFDQALVSSDFELNIASVIAGNSFDKTISIGNATVDPSATLHIMSKETYTPTLLVDGIYGQTAHLQDWMNGLNGIPTWVNNSGIINANSGIVYTQGIPKLTTNTVYNSGGYLYWDQCQILTDCSYEKVYRHTSDSNYTIKLTDENIIVDCTPSANITLTLPQIKGIVGKKLTIKRSYSSAYYVIIAADSSPIQETIDGLNTYSLTTTYQTVTLLSDGTEKWKIISGL